MVKKRWYDKDPTTSMAVSLLQNANKRDQLKTTKYIYQQLEQEGYLDNPDITKTFEGTYIFPFRRRQKLEQSASRLLEVLKHLPTDVQVEMSLHMINFMYLLDSGTLPSEMDLENQALKRVAEA
ncbi:MAG: hypothetical protein KTR14_05045 [Vampirovibrio sp.]|nr:hypothetical protein [Vampirovibrio sp.]